MDIRVVTIGVEELIAIINSERETAYSKGYIKAKEELENVKVEPKFNEVLRGVKELREYLMHKNYWAGSINTLNKVAYQLVSDEDRRGHGLVFRCGCIDHAFQTNFRFQQPSKKPVIT